MKEFTSIESFRHVVQSVKKYCASRSKPLPEIEYFGTVKLHGTNAGVRVTADGVVQPQKRSGIVSIGADNAGFAAFCHDKQDLFRLMAKPYGPDVTFFGEWVGGNIQNQGDLAVRSLEKHFVIFNAYSIDENAESDEDFNNYVWYNSFDLMMHFQYYIKVMNDAGVWAISQIAPYEITVDFSRPEESLAKLEELTLAVENECPWGKFRGVSGVGEGIVWIPVSNDYNQITDLWFKTKGTKHAQKDPMKKGKTNIEASPEKLGSIREVVEKVLPEWRLAQGLSVLREDNKAIIPENTGLYLQWISKDILKEEADVIVANGLTWKDIVRYIMTEARQYYLKAMDAEVFGNEETQEA